MVVTLFGFIGVVTPALAVVGVVVAPGAAFVVFRKKHLKRF